MFVCQVCSGRFPSNNKLFDYLRASHGLASRPDQTSREPTEPSNQLRRCGAGRTRPGADAGPGHAACGARLLSRRLTWMVFAFWFHSQVLMVLLQPRGRESRLVRSLLKCSRQTCIPACMIQPAGEVSRLGTDTARWCLGSASRIIGRVRPAYQQGTHQNTGPLETLSFYDLHSRATHRQSSHTCGP